MDRFVETGFALPSAVEEVAWATDVAASFELLGL
jgi:hypothetical protein